MTSEERKAWLRSLKVGDEVADYCVGAPVEVSAIEKIEGFTKKQILCGYGKKYWKHNGVDARFENRNIIPVQQSMRDYRDRVECSRMLGWMSYRVEQLPITTVRKLLSLLTEAEREAWKENQKEEGQ